MPESGGVIYVKGIDGVFKEVTLYTDISDVTDDYKEFKYNGNVVYAATTTDPDDEFATEFRYKDTEGTVRYLCTENPIPEKSGTVVINGDLSTDLVVDGNLQVTGTISGKATSSGKITYGSLTGTAKAGASFTSCDIAVEDGTLTLATDVSESSGGLYTAGTVTNGSGTTTTLYSAFTIETSSERALYNNSGVLVIENGAKINLTSTASSGYGVYVNRNSTMTVASGGKVTAKGGSYGMFVSSSSTTTFRIESGGTLNAEGSNYGVFVSGGTMTFSGTVNATATDSSGYGLYISTSSARFTVESGGTLNAVGGGYGLEVYNGTMTVESDGTATAEGSTFGGVYVYSDGTLTVGGTLYAIAPNDSNCIRGTVTTTGSGKVYANGVLQ